METIEVRTTIQVSPERAFDFLVDFEGYSDYSKYLEEVTADGAAGEGTEYEITFGWWRLSYTIRTAVTQTSHPDLIEWAVLSDIEAHGRWEIQSQHSNPGSTLVRFIVSYDPESAKGAGIDIPAFVSLDWVIDRVIGLIEAEGRRVVERVVADLEGTRRTVDLTVEHH